MKETKQYFFEYQRLIEESEYNIFNSYPINIIDYSNGVNQSDYYKPQLFFGGRTLSVKFTLEADSNDVSTTVHADTTQEEAKETTTETTAEKTTTNELGSYDELLNNN